MVISFSCSENQIVMRNESNVVSDSVLLYRSDSVVRIFIGDRIMPLPLSSQLVEDELGKNYYVILDENTLHWFDLEDGKLFQKRELNDCGTLNNYSGFLCLKDTTFVYNYKQKTVYMFDSLYAVNRKWKVAMAKEDLIDPEALTDSPLLYADNKLMLSGVKLQDLNKKNKNLAVSCNIDVLDGELALGGHYPEQYYKGNFGGVYFNSIYHTLAAGGYYLYSFPADHYVYFYSSDFTAMKKCFMGSRYSSEITSADFDYIDLFKDKDARIRYFIGQHSYSNILYDKYRKVYYRIAQHPLENWNPGDSFIKPFSIIVMDETGEILSETPIQKDYALLNLHNMHVSREGLLIQKKTADENSIDFVKYVWRGNEDKNMGI